MPSKNIVLRSFGAELHHLAPHLSPVSFQTGQIIKDQWEMVDRVYFPTSGLVSARAVLESGHQLECALIGRTNAVGVVATIGFDRAMTRFVCLTDGHGWAIPLSNLEVAMRASPIIERQLKVYSFAQVGYGLHVGVCNALHNAEQRVARWLTTAADLLGEAEVRLPQEEFASGLGLQRSALNPVLQKFKLEQLVDVTRGRVRIINGDRLSQRACECRYILRRAIFLGTDTRP